MRIPVFRSEARPRNELPGRSFSVRMNARPFIEAELQKGEIMTELASQAGAFAQQRYNMITEAEYNEAALKIEEGMQEAILNLSKSSDYRNVLDGRNMWNEHMQAIKDNVLPSVSNRALRKKLTYSFDQSEITSRYQLQTVIDRKIIAAEQSALKSRTESVVNVLSQPGVNVENYNAEMAKLNNAHVPGVTSGRLNGSAVSTALGAAKKDIATNVVSNYVGQDPLRAIELLAAFEQAVDINNGVVIPDKDLAQLAPGGTYAVFTLANIQGEEALSVIEDSLRSATVFANALEKLEKSNENAQKFVVDQAKNRIQYFTSLDPSTLISGVEIVNFIPALKSSINPQQNYSASEALNAAKDYLYSVNAVDPALQKIFDNYEIGELSPFAETTEQFTFDTLFNNRISGSLDFNTLQNFKGALTREDYLYFANAIITDENRIERKKSGNQTAQEKAADTALDAAKKIAKSKYRYNALQTDDSERNRASKAATFNVLQKLDELELEFVLSEKILTPQKINEVLQAAFVENDQIYQDGLRVEFDEYIQGINIPGLTLDPTDPFGSLDAWYASADQNRQGNNYGRIKRRLNEFRRQGLF